MNITVDKLEYAAPEILEYYHQLEGNAKNKDILSLNLYNSSNRWSFDVWSFGIVLVEIIAGVPVWFDIRSRLFKLDGKPKMAEGILVPSDKNVNRKEKIEILMEK